MHTSSRFGGNLRGFQDVQRDQQDHSLRDGRLLQHRPTSVGGADRLQDIRSMFGKIAGRKQSATASRSLGDRRGDRASVEVLESLSQTPQGPGEIALPEHRALVGRSAIGEKDRHCGRIGGGDLHEVAKVVGQSGGNGKALLGVGDRVLEQRRRCHRAMSLQRDPPGIHDARDRRRQPARFRDAAGEALQT